MQIESKALIRQESIPVFNKRESKLIELFLRSVEEDRSIIGFTLSIVEKILKENVVHIIFAARQGSPFEALVTGYLEALGINGPTMSHIAVNVTGFRPGADLSTILKTSVQGKKLFIDHTSQNGNTARTLLDCALNLDPLSDYEFMHNYRYAPWDIEIGSYPGPYMSPHKFTKADNDEDLIGPNPRKPKLVESVEEISIYKRLYGLLWILAYDKAQTKDK